MKKEAQKGVKDPVQQKLRQNKKQWSKDTSVLIAQLIAFKRGLNGRGDPRAGLPASNIKEPLPNEIETYMNQMVQRFQEIIDRASNIIDEQAEYSKNRRKGKEEGGSAGQQRPETSLPVAAALRYELEKNARLWDRSGPVSRMIAYVMQYPWFSGEKNEITKTKLELMYAAADFENRLNDVEYALTSFDKNSQTKAFYDFSRFVILFQRRFMETFNEAIKMQAEFYSKNEETIGLPPERPEKNPVVAEAEAENEEDRNQEQQAVEAQRQAAQEQGEFPRVSPNSPGNEQDSENEIPEQQSQITLEKIEKDMSDIHNDLGGAMYLSQLAEAYANKYENDDSVDKVMPASVLEGVDEMRKAADKVRKAAKSGKMQGVMEAYQTVVNNYQQHVADLAKTWGLQENTIYGIIKALQPKVASVSDKILMKLASKHRLERWMQRVRLSIYTDQYEADRLETAKLLRDAADDLDIIQELLEDKEALFVDVGLYVQKLYNTLGQLCKYFAYIGKYHNYMYGSERSVGQRPTLGQINTDQIRLLEKYSDVFETQAIDLSKVTIEDKKDSEEPQSQKWDDSV